MAQTDSDQNGADFTTGPPNPRRTEPVIELGPWVAGTNPGTRRSTTVPYDASVTVNFSEPVNVDPAQTAMLTGCEASQITVPRKTMQPTLSVRVRRRGVVSFVLMPAKKRATENSTTPRM